MDASDRRDSRRLDDRPLTPPHALPSLPQIRGDPRDLSRGASQAAHGARGLQGARARYPDPRPMSDLPSDRSTPTKAAGGRFTDAFFAFDDGAWQRLTFPLNPPQLAIHPPDRGARGEAPRRRGPRRTRRDRHPPPAQGRGVGGGAPRGAQGDGRRSMLRRLPRGGFAVAGLRGGQGTDQVRRPVRVPVAPEIRQDRPEDRRRVGG